MGSEDKIATWALKIDANAKDVDAAAASLENYKAAVAGSQQSIAQLNQVQRALKGSSDEVKAAKVTLKAAIDAERSAITAATLAQIKQGASLGDLTAKQKKAEGGATSFGDAMRKIGGPTVEISDKLETVKAAVTTAGGAFASLGVAVTAEIAILSAVTFAIVGVTVALGKWILEAGNANRTAALLREGWTGSAESGRNLGIAIDNMTRVVPTARDELTKLGQASVKSFSGTRVSGQGIIDTMNAVAQASSVMGDEVGGQLAELVKRGRQFGRVQINPLEFVGQEKGVRFDDIAAALGKITGKGVLEARDALFQGRVEVNLFAKALRQATEIRFGDTNKRQMTDLTVVAKRLHEGLDQLTKDIDFSPLNAGLEKLLGLFDQSTVGGKALHDAVTATGDAMARLLGTVGSGDAITRFETAVIKMATSVVKVLLFVKHHWDLVTGSIDAARTAIGTLASAIPGVGTAIAGIGLVRNVAAALGGGNAAPAAAALPEATPEQGSAPVVRRGGVAGHAEGGLIPRPAPGEIFVSASPGETVVPAGMTLEPKGGAQPALGPQGPAGPIVLHVTVDARGHHDARGVVQAMTSRQTLGEITKALEDLLRTMGLPVQTAAGVE